MGPSAAEVARTPDAEGPPSPFFMRKVVFSLPPSPLSFFPFLPFANPELPNYENQGSRIFEQMDGRVDDVVLGCGTCGTFLAWNDTFSSPLSFLSSLLFSLQARPGGGQAGRTK